MPCRLSQTYSPSLFCFDAKDFGCASVSDDFLDDEDDPAGSVARNKARKPKKLPSAGKTLASSTGTTAYWPPERFAAKSAVEGGDDAALLCGATPEMDMWSVGTSLAYTWCCACHVEPEC
jgi:serine/threonine protein kinase